MFELIQTRSSHLFMKGRSTGVFMTGTEYENENMTILTFDEASGKICHFKGFVDPGIKGVIDKHEKEYQDRLNAA